MGKRVEVKTEMTAEMLYERYRKAKDPVERTHWHILWQAQRENRHKKFPNCSATPLYEFDVGMRRAKQ